MPKTLADYSPDERDQMVGMWCYIFDREPEPGPPVAEGIIAGYREADDGRTLTIIDHPHPDAGKWGHDLIDISPRPDLPRAWNANGAPVETVNNTKSHYEYAAQVQEKPGDMWQSTFHIHSSHDYGLTSVPWLGDWYGAENDARIDAEEYDELNEPHATRIVRRTVGEIEVIE